MDLLLTLVCVDVLLGGAAVYLAYTRLPAGLPRVLGTSVLLAIFFSLTIVVYRIVVVPLPTFVVLVEIALDLYRDLTTPCVMHPSEGCVPPTGADGPAFVLGPVLAQWAIWFILLGVVETVRGARVARPKPRNLWDGLSKRPRR